MVVVGYGHQKKASVIGSISTIDMAGVKVPGSSISSVLAGQLAGVVAMNRTGEPGKPAQPISIFEGYLLLPVVTLHWYW